MACISLRNLTKRWGDFVAVDTFDLDIRDQEFLVLLGPSGCGKTTTMRMIAGLEEISEGDILVDGERINDLEPKDRDIAMVFQSYGLYPNMSVYENIRFPLKVRKVDTATHDTRVRRAAEKVELTDYLHRRPAELSGGQRQRVALARAIVREPNVFLMDEPLSNLDAKLRVSTRAQIKHLHHELKVTTIYVTHDQIEAMTLADRVVVMNKGVVQQIDTPTEIYDRPRNVFVAGFIGNPAMNLIKGSVTNGVFAEDNITIHGLDVVDRNVTLGFRAEDAALAEMRTKTRVSKTTGLIQAPIYALELLGDATMITVRVGGTMVAVKAPKDFRAAIGEPVQINLPRAACHLFDGHDGMRIGGGE
jgi:multiple sugar transport system ATP-binding protein